MSTLKTDQHEGDVHLFLSQIEHPQRKADSAILYTLIKTITGLKPKMWGSAIVGFGSYHYKYESGREGDWFITGFSPRKQSMTIYVIPGFDRYKELMGKLGKHKKGKSCLYINKLKDVDMDILKSLITESVKYMKNKYRN